MDELLAHLPMAVVVLVLGLVFKKPLFAWLNRFGRVKAGETVFEVSQVEQQISATKENQISGDGLLSSQSSTIESTAVVATRITTTSAADPARAAVLRTVGVSPLVTEREEEIRRDLLNLPENEQRDLLIRNLAIAQLQTMAEQIYRLIFSPQLDLLKHLNLFGPTPIEKLIELFYDVARNKHPAAYSKISTDGFFQYLLTNNLIVAVQDNTAYALTVKGKAFLEWIVSQGILVQKPF